VQAKREDVMLGDKEEVLIFLDLEAENKNSFYPVFDETEWQAGRQNSLLGGGSPRGRGDDGG
jgi:hypothetical protein